MTYRRHPASDRAAEALLRGVLDRLDRIEAGTTLAGRVSVGTPFRIADVAISVEPSGGDTVRVVFTNLATGASYTIQL